MDLNINWTTQSQTAKLISCHAMGRISETLVYKLCKLLKAIVEIGEKDLSPDVEKHQSMAKVYITGAILELEKMAICKHNETRRAYYSKRN